MFQSKYQIRPIGHNLQHSTENIFQFYEQILWVKHSSNGGNINKSEWISAAMYVYKRFVLNILYIADSVIVWLN